MVKQLLMTFVLCTIAAALTGLLLYNKPEIKQNPIRNRDMNAKTDTMCKWTLHSPSSRDKPVADWNRAAVDYNKERTGVIAAYLWPASCSLGRMLCSRESFPDAATSASGDSGR
jgi:hypothetical protein